MHLVDLGSGTPLVLLHPFPFDGRIYAEVAPALASSARVLTLDFPGFGQSRETAPTHVDDYARAVINVLDDLRLPRAIVGGLSFGGYVSLAFARLFPDRLAGLLLASTRAAADTPAILEQRAEATKITREQGVHALVAKQLPTWLPPRPPDEARDQATSIALSQRPAAVIAAIEAMRTRPDATALLPTIAVPTRVVSGTEDVLTKPAEMQRLCAIPRSTFHSIEGAGHLVPQTHPGAFVEAARTLVDEVG